VIEQCGLNAKIFFAPPAEINLVMSSRQNFCDNAAIDF
jgi:hypothetical protein